MGTMKNAKNQSINSPAGFTPDVSGAVQNYFQPMTFILVSKRVEGGWLIESGNQNENVFQDPVTGQKVAGQTINFRGFMKPYKPKELEIKAAGERSWTWQQLVCETQLQLETDDVVIFGTTQYRVMSKADYSLYGYMRYKLVEDYQFSGPLINVGNDSAQDGTNGDQVTDGQGNVVIY